MVISTLEIYIGETNFLTIFTYSVLRLGSHKSKLKFNFLFGNRYREVDNLAFAEVSLTTPYVKLIDLNKHAFMYLYSHTLILTACTEGYCHFK